MRYLCAALLLSCPIFGQSLLPNGNFETGTTVHVPPNWFLAGNSPGFTAQITNSGCVEGKQCAVLQGPANPAALRRPSPRRRRPLELIEKYRRFHPEPRST